MDAREEFAAQLERDEADIDLGRAALLFARVEYPDLDVDAYLCRFDAMAADLRAVLRQRMTNRPGDGRRRRLVSTVHLPGE